VTAAAQLTGAPSRFNENEPPAWRKTPRAPRCAQQPEAVIARRAWSILILAVSSRIKMNQQKMYPSRPSRLRGLTNRSAISIGCPPDHHYRRVPLITGKGGQMAQIILKTDMPNQAAKFLVEVLETEQSRLKYTMKIAKRRLSRFEKKYSVTSEKFMEEWSAEDLEGKDLEYVEWAGEYNLTKRLDERLNALKSIEHVPS